MSLLIRWGVRSVWGSIIEVIAFFALSAAGVWGAQHGYRAIFDSTLPIWGWILLGAAYLVLVTIWWSPGEKADNEKELLAFAIVAAGTVIVGGIFIQAKYGTLLRLWSTFWEIMLGGS